MGIAALHPSYGLENHHRFIYNHSIEQKPKRAHARKGISAMPVTHEPWLVALSLVVAIQGAYVGLSLAVRSEEHTSELQSLRHLVCRLLLEKKKKREDKHNYTT